MKYLDIFSSIKLNKIGGELAWILFGQIIVVIGSLVGVRFLTEFMLPSDYGELSLGLTISTLVGQLLMGPLSNGITRYYSAACEALQLHSYNAAVVNLIVKAIVILINFSVVLITILFFFDQADLIITFIASLSFALLSGLENILSGIQNANRQRRIVALHQGMAVWLRFGFGIIFLINIKSNSVVVLFGYACAMVIVIISQLFFLNKKSNKVNLLYSDDHELNWRSKILEYSCSFSISGIFTWAYVVSDRWALELFSSSESVGFFSVLYQLGYYPITLITGLFVQLISPIFAQRVGDASNNNRIESVYALNWLLTWFSLALSLFAFLLALLLHKQIFIFFAAQKYAGVSYLLPWIMLAGGLFSTGQAASLSAMTSKVKSLMLPKIITALLGVSLNIYGAKFYGIEGVVIASVMYSVIYLIAILWLNLNEHKQLKFQN